MYLLSASLLLLAVLGVGPNGDPSGAPDQRERAVTCPASAQEGGSEAPQDRGKRIGESGPRNDLTTILLDRAVWGKDLPAALAHLPGWGRIGESRVAVFADRVVGARAFATREAARRAAGRRVETAGAPKPRAEFAGLLKGSASRQEAAPFRVEALPFLPDDDSLHLTWPRPSGRILTPGLTVARVEERFGPPEEVTRETVQTEKDTRPVVLTLYRYAGGAVVFAESDWAPEPGFVDRVLLDVTAVTARVFQEAK